MDANTPLWKAHDLSQQLQDKIEVLPNVGRAFVHVDHETTHVPVRPLSLSLPLRHNIKVADVPRLGTPQTHVVCSNFTLRATSREPALAHTRALGATQ